MTARNSTGGCNEAQNQQYPVSPVHDAEGFAGILVCVLFEQLMITVVTIATPPIHKTTANTCKTLARVRYFIMICCCFRR